MKSVYETFTDEEFSQLEAVKGKMTWHSFILQLTKITPEKAEKESEPKNIAEMSIEELKELKLTPEQLYTALQEIKSHERKI